MAETDINGLPIYQGSDPADLESALNLLSAATSSALDESLRIFIVANNTARNALAVERPPTADNPLLVWVKSTTKFQLNNGSGWRDWPEQQDIPDLPEVTLPGPNELIIGGKTYQASGTWAVTTGNIVTYTGVKQNTVYLNNITKALPFDLPSGWTVEVSLVKNGGRYGSLSVGAISGRNVTMRYMQYYNNSKVPMTIGWRLIKTG